MDAFDNHHEDPRISEGWEEDRSAQEPSGQEQSTAAPSVPVQPDPPREQDNPSYYHDRGTGRKESPFADSPYVLNREPAERGYQYQPQTEPPEKKPRKSHRGFWKGTAAVLLVVALVAAGCGITAAAVNDYWEERTEDTVSQLNERIDTLEEQLEDSASGGWAAALPSDGSAMTPSQLYQTSVDCVVAISSIVQTNDFYFGSGTGSASGSGFVLSEDGYVVTNYHVIEGASAVNVVLHDGTEYPAQVVGYDATNDLAVLKVEATGLSAARIGSSDSLSIGDMVVAIGNPLGELTATQTVGYVSGIKREVTTSNTIMSMIQTDAAINPGNSGGPLFNMYGEVIGITTAKYSGTTDSGASIEGIGFAIPIDDVMNAISELVDQGYVSTAYLGVTVTDTDEESAAMFNLPTGAYVASVEEGYSAHRAGIQAKDIIIALGDTTVSNQFELVRALREYDPGDETTITILRGGKEMTLDITLDEKPQDLQTEDQQTQPTQPESEDFDSWYDYFRRYFGE